MPTFHTLTDWLDQPRPLTTDQTVYAFLRDPQRIHGAGVRVWQSLVLPAVAVPFSAYDVYADSLVRLMNPPHAHTLLLVRCRVAQ
jgi:hypothetical protein